VARLMDDHAADTRRNKESHNTEIRIKNEEITNRNNQYQQERDAWFLERSKIEQRHVEEIHQKNDLIEKNNKDHLAKVEALE